MALEKDEILGKLPEGKFVVAVSGGVDSAALLHLVAENVDSDRVVVAHVDHGMRVGSAAEARFVRELAKSYSLKYVETQLELGKEASEAEARRGRYAFLSRISHDENAPAILTAHHRDDVIETMVINLMRGTNRRGLTSLGSSTQLIRPLLGVTKLQLYKYATDNRLEFVEDDSNKNTDYKRNWVRRVGLPKLRNINPSIDSKLQDLNKKTKLLNDEIDEISVPMAESLVNDNRVNREEYRALPEIIRREIIMQTLIRRDIDMKNIGRSDIERTDDFICNAKPAKKFNPTKQIHFLSSRDYVEILVT